MDKKLKKTVAIIGGGISGLSAAYHLHSMARKSGEAINYFLIEKEDRLGGNILTEVEDGFIIEGGPDCFISEKLAAIQLCHQLGLQDRLMKTNEEYQRTFILWEGKLHELPQGFMLIAPTNFSSVIKNSLITPLGKFRMAMDLLIPAKRSDEDESLAQFVRRRLGKEVLERIAQPLVAGIHAGDPETMSLKSTFPRFKEMENNYRSLILGMIKKKKLFLKEKSGKESKSKYTTFMSLKSGLSELTGALKATLKPEAIITRNGVVTLEKLIGKTDDFISDYSLKLTDGRSLKAQAVIFATPAFITAEILKGIDKELAEELLSIPYVSTATVSLAYRKKDILHPLNGFGFVVPEIEKRKIMASTWSSIKFPNRAPEDKLLIRCFVGGSKDEHLVNLNKPEIIAMVQEELRDIMGIRAEPLFIKVYKWEKSMPQYIVGHEEKLKRIEFHLSSHPGLFLAGSAYQGIGISDCIKSGEKAAKAAFEFLHSKNYCF